MKTSLVCLLLLAAVACAAPKAGEAEMARMAEEAEMARMAEEAEMARMAEEAVEAGAAAGAELQAKVGGKRESRSTFHCYGFCYGPNGEFGCWFDSCYNAADFLFFNGHCACCDATNIDKCY